MLPLFSTTWSSSFGGTRAYGDCREDCVHVKCVVMELSSQCGCVCFFLSSYIQLVRGGWNCSFNWGVPKQFDLRKNGGMGLLLSRSSLRQRQWFLQFYWPLILSPHVLNDSLPCERSRQDSQRVEFKQNNLDGYLRRKANHQILITFRCDFFGVPLLGLVLGQLFQG